MRNIFHQSSYGFVSSKTWSLDQKSGVPQGVNFRTVRKKSNCLGKPKEIDLDGPYGSKDLNFHINVPTKLPSFDVGVLIVTIFGKLKLPYLPA